MVILTQGAATEKIVLTLDEKKTIASPVYVFTATHVTTNQEISFVLGTDLSNYPERYNEFQIDTAVEFLNAPEGQWNYVVTEQESGLEVENGKLLLNKATEFSYNGYAPATSYSGYAG
jgi:hypothetical protein